MAAFWLALLRGSRFLDVRPLGKASAARRAELGMSTLAFLSVNMALYSVFHILKLKAEKISSCAQRFGGQKSCDVYCYFNLRFVYLCDESVS